MVRSAGVVPHLVSPNPPRQLHVLAHDGDSLSVDAAQDTVLKQLNEIGLGKEVIVLLHSYCSIQYQWFFFAYLCCFLQCLECRPLEAQVLGVAEKATGHLLHQSGSEMEFFSHVCFICL